MRIPTVTSWILGILTSAALIILLVQHGTYVGRYPYSLGFLFCPFLALLLFFTNAAHLSFRNALSHFGFGFLATIAAFVFQSVINGELLRLVGDKTFPGAMTLGFGSGLLQTLAKLGFVLLAYRLLPTKEHVPLLSAGFGIGLGFGVTEAVLIGVQDVQLGTPVTNLIGIVERGAAIWFHLSSGGLIAAGIWLRDAKPVLLVILLHTLMDGLAVYLAPRIGLVTLEAIFWGLAAICWLAWIFTYRGLRRRQV